MRFIKVQVETSWLFVRKNCFGYRWLQKNRETDDRMLVHGYIRGSHKNEGMVSRGSLSKDTKTFGNHILGLERATFGALKFSNSKTTIFALLKASWMMTPC